MATFKIPVTWEVYGTVHIEASTLKDAIAIFDETEDDISLPTEPNYVDASFQREKNIALIASMQ
jgi:hypothetical protein